MRMLRTLLTLLLCFTLPHTALASALRDPQCLSSHAEVNHDPASVVAADAGDSMMDSMPGMAHEMSAMNADGSGADSPHHPANDHCGCLLGCTCVQACGVPACNSGLDGDGSRLLVLLRQESPPAPRIADRRPAPITELLRPPSLRA